MKSIWTTEELAILKGNINLTPIELETLLPGKKALQICKKKYKVSENNTTVKNRAKSRKYSFNRDFFKTQTLESCYLAGFIAADGCITNSTKGKDLSIALSNVDYIHLEMIRNLLGYTGSVKQYFRTKTNYSESADVCALRIYGLYEVAEDLEKNFSITPVKSLTLKKPNISTHENKIAYTIGLIDGDGSLNISTLENGKKSVSIGVLGTTDVLSFIAELFDVVFPHYRITTNITNSHNSPAISINGRRAEEIIKILLQVPVPRLARKWDKFNYLLEGKYLHSDRFYKTCQTTVQ